ncbi:hypothetical protein [Pollutibacter soli]|uniref:hypothetical protein n=1 Tax=Pollutibacter soli TaxID=3034157 RepID=UPI0030138588
MEQQIRMEELEIRKKELDLKIQEQKSKTIFTPLVISIAGGLITLITGIVLKYYDSKSITALEDKKFQSTLLLKATEAKNYDEFSDMLLVFQDNGMLSLDSSKIRKFRKKKFISENLLPKLMDENLSPGLQKQQLQNIDFAGANLIQKNAKTDSTAVSLQGDFSWTIVAGGDSNLERAKFKQAKFTKAGFSNVDVIFRNRSFRTCIGKYTSYQDALNDLFEVKEKIKNDAYIVRFDNWCKYLNFDKTLGYYICK